MQLLSRLTRGLPRLDMLMALANQALISGMTFAIGILVARMLGLGEFGRLALVLILQLFAQYLQGCFIVSPMMALSGGRVRRSRNYYAAVMAWSGTFSVLAGIAVGSAIAVIYGLRDGSVPFALAAAAGAFTASQNLLYTVRRMLFAGRKGGQALLMDTARYAALAVAIALQVYRGGAIDVALLLSVLAATGLLALIPAWLTLRGARLRRGLIRAVWARHWPFGRWLALMLILAFGQEQAIALGLGAVLGDDAIGGLRAGQYLIGTTHFVWVALENFVPGSASRAFASSGMPGLVAVLQRTTVVFGAIVWGVILLVSLPAELSLRLAFGPGYETFAPILRLYGLAYAIAFAREVWIYFFYATERTEVIFRAFACGFLVAAIAFLPAIKVFGITGAALTVLLANTTSTAYVVIEAWRRVRLASADVAAKAAAQPAE